MPRRRLVTMGDSWAIDHFGPLNSLWLAKYPDAPASLNYGRGGTFTQEWLDAWDSVVTHPDGDIGPLNTVLQPGDMIYMSVGGNDELIHGIEPANPLLGHAQQRAARRELMGLMFTIPDLVILIASYFGTVYGTPNQYADEPALLGPFPRPSTSRRTLGEERPWRREPRPALYNLRTEYLYQLAMLDSIQDGIHLDPVSVSERADTVDAESIIWNYFSEF